MNLNSLTVQFLNNHVFHRPGRILVASTMNLVCVGWYLWLYDPPTWSFARVISGLVLLVVLYIFSVASSYYWIRYKRRELR